MKQKLFEIIKKLAEHENVFLNIPLLTESILFAKIYNSKITIFTSQGLIIEIHLNNDGNIEEVYVDHLSSCSCSCG